MSWKQVVGDNPVNDFLHPDYSPASAKKALDDMGQTWKDTAHDMSQNQLSETVATLTNTQDEYNQGLENFYGPTAAERAEQQQQQGNGG